MERTIFMVLLIQYGILLQDSESLPETNSKALLDRHVRKKRIIDESDDRDESVLNQEVRYVVLIRDASGSPQCTGIILQANIILTAAHCVINGPISIVSGRTSSRHIEIHEIVGYVAHEDYIQSLKLHDIALILLRKPIDIEHSYHRAIKIFDGEIPPNSHGLVTGWGCINRTGELQNSPHALSILVPIIPVDQCQEMFRKNKRLLSYRNICTLYQNRTKSCWFGDSGGPLTFNRRLIGVFSWFIPNNSPHFPDVFVNLLIPEYRSWISTRLYNIHNYIH